MFFLFSSFLQSVFLLPITINKNRYYKLGKKYFLFLFAHCPLLIFLLNKQIHDLDLKRYFEFQLLYKFISTKNAIAIA